MKIGIFTDSLGRLSFEEMLDWCVTNGISAIEVGTGNFSSTRHCNLAQLLVSDRARDEYQEAVLKRGLYLSALNCSGNILDASAERLTRSQKIFFDTLHLAGLLGVKTVVAMSGCPGEGSATGQYPNWVTSTWQPEYQELLVWQWKEAVEPFWRGAARFAEDHGVRIAIEMHPGQVVFNPYTLQQLREITGDVAGANLDPSHLFWQGIDPLRVIQSLGATIYHVHIKDCWINSDELAMNGVLDNRLTKTRTWGHCPPGQGHDEHFWRQFLAALKTAGYDGTLSIEYAGPLTGIESGIRDTVALLNRVS
jgi:sugar phosphate isomerase/epimerase